MTLVLARTLLMILNFQFLFAVCNSFQMHAFVNFYTWVTKQTLCVFIRSVGLGVQVWGNIS